MAGSADFQSPDPERATRELKAAAHRRARRSGVALSPSDLYLDACACATPKPTRWASSTTPTTSSGSKSAGPICCGTAAGAIARWRPTAISLPVLEAALRVPPAGALRRRARGADDGALLSPVRVRFDYERRPPGRRRRRLPTGHTVHASLDRNGRPCRLPDRVRRSCSKHEGAGHRRRRVHRLDARRAAARRRRRRRRHRLLHRLLPADRSRSGISRRCAAPAAFPLRRVARSRTPIWRACWPTARTCFIWRRRRACARAGDAISRLYDEQHRGHAAPARGAASARALERLVYASSSSVYGDDVAMPMREDALPQPVSPYGVTKLAAEQLCHLYHVNDGVPAVSLRYFTVYGPRQRPDMGFHRFLTAAILDQPIACLRRRRADARLHVCARCGRGQHRRGARREFPAACTILEADRGSRSTRCSR